MKYPGEDVHEKREDGSTRKKIDTKFSGGLYMQCTSLCSVVSQRILIQIYYSFNLFKLGTIYSVN